VWRLGELTYGSLFTGIGAADLAFDRCGMVGKWQCEIDVKAREIENRHWPEMERFEDVRTIGRRNLSPVDLIVGGFPCQDLSVAGKRAGLAGVRSGLWFEFARVIDELETKWVVIENVPGLLSSDRGRDFAVIVQWLAKRGYCVVWRVLDSQYFGVAQRRRRVFVVASFGNGSAAEVLFESEGMFGHTAPRRETREEDPAVSGNVSETTSRISEIDTRVTCRLPASGAGLDRPSGSGNQLDFCIPYDTSNLSETGSVAMTLQSKKSGGYSLNYSPVVFTPGNLARGAGENPNESVVGTLVASKFGDRFPHVAYGYGVRRLTPVECERLQGFPDGWTDGQSDSSRYKQLGNAMTVNVLEWIGRRIVIASKYNAQKMPP